jgi:ABC-2 type transport system permease protein
MIIADIACNELRRLFLTPLAWIMLALVQFLLAMFMFLLLSSYLEQTAIRQGHGITEIVVAGMLQMAGLIMLLVTPMLTMRLFSDEQRHGTLSLLLSAPVSITTIVLGKYLGVLLFMCCSLLLTALMIGCLWFGTALDPGQLAAALLGLALLMSSLCAIGLFFSTLTRQPAIAATATFAVLFILWILNMTGNSGGELAGVLGYLSMLRHYNNLLTGMFSSVDVCYYLIISGLFLLLSIWRLDAIRTCR